MRSLARSALERMPQSLRALVNRMRAAIRPARWSIRIGAPEGPQGDVWGDTAFAEDLAEALRRRGQEVFVDRWDSRNRPDGRHDDVAIALRGLHLPPKEQGAVNVLWVISHPDMVSDDEIQSGYDLVFAASKRWSAARSVTSGQVVRPLLQATNPRRFHPGAPIGDLASDVLFVGTTREIFRPIVRDAIEAGASISLYGHGWEQFVDPQLIRADHLDNSRLPDAYRSAQFVLNDHWPDMRREGFLSNRLFDAAAVGARVVSDEIDGLGEVFGAGVRSYSSVDELRALIADPASWPSVKQRRARARRIARLHSFDRRAVELIAAVKPHLKGKR